MQLVSPTTSVHLTKKGIKDVVVYTPERLLEDGFTPASFIDYKALRGDVSDNIPGIPGVGEVTAKNLLKEYGSLDEILKNAENVKEIMGIKSTLKHTISFLLHGETKPIYANIHYLSPNEHLKGKKIVMVRVGDIVKRACDDSFGRTDRRHFGRFEI